MAPKPIFSDKIAGGTFAWIPTDQQPLQLRRLHEQSLPTAATEQTNQPGEGPDRSQEGSRNGDSEAEEYREVDAGAEDWET